MLFNSAVLIKTLCSVELDELTSVEKLIVGPTSQEIACLYVTLGFVTVFTIDPCPTSIRCVEKVSSHLCLARQSTFFPSDFLIKVM